MSTHFYTTSDSEAAAALANMTAVSEGDRFYVYTVASPYVPMYRLNHSGRATHLFTTYIDERDAAINEDGFLGEGIAFWCLTSSGSTQGLVKLFRAYNPSTDDYFYTINESEIQNAPAYKAEGVACMVFSMDAGSLVPLFRLRSPAGHHFYTVNPSERQLLLNAQYIDEGTCGFVVGVDPGGASPFYRSYNPITGGHLYTVSIAENDGASKNFGFRGDGISGFIYPDGSQLPGMTKLLRCFNGEFDDHFYTVDPAEFSNALTNLGYVDEGIAGWVQTSDVGPVQFSTPMHRLAGDFAENFFLLPPPPKYLSSNSNYYLNSIIGANTNVIPQLTVEIDITSDISVTSVNFGSLGCTFQLNAYSPQNFTSAWQQYVFRFEGTTIGWSINNYSDSPYAHNDILGNGDICSLQQPILHAGISLKISLIYDSYHAVLGAEFSVFDNGEMIGQKNVLVRDLGNGVAFGSAPIIAFQMVLVGDGDGSKSTFASGGSGIFRYLASTPMFASVSPPALSENAGFFTVETGNSVYGEISATKSLQIVQKFTTNGTAYGLPLPGGLPKKLSTQPRL